MMFGFASIYKAYKACLKHKSNTQNALHFQTDILQNLHTLSEELQQRRYVIGKSICFLTHSPKLREIFAANFKDRVVHHVLINALQGFYEKKFIYDVYNNRANKGTHKASQRAKFFMNAFCNSYYLQLDIKGFFYNLDKNILFKTLLDDISTSNLCNKEDILYLSNKIIYHNPTRNFHFKGDKNSLANLPPHKTLFKIPKTKGLPIGNVTSQFFANVYMNRFDHFIKRELKCKYYIRYVDDFVLFHESKEYLLHVKTKIQEYLNINLHLSLREDSKLKPNKAGLDFLGYIIKPTHTLVRKRVVNNFKYKKAKYLDSYEKQKGKMPSEEIKQFLSVQASFLAHIKWANSYRLKSKIGEIDEEKYSKYFNTMWSA